VEGVVNEGRESRLYLGSIHVPLWVFSCGEAEPGFPLGGAMQCGGGRGAKRLKMGAVGATVLGRRGMVERDGRGEGAPL
jgi:hypothetical protein